MMFFFLVFLVLSLKDKGKHLKCGGGGGLCVDLFIFNLF